MSPLMLMITELRNNAGAYTNPTDGLVAASLILDWYLIHHVATWPMLPESRMIALSDAAAHAAQYWDNRPNK